MTTAPPATIPDLRENDRLQQLEELTEEHGPELERRFAPGSFGCHELLDRTQLLARLVEDSLCEHPSCVQNPEWHRLASQAADTLHELYQRIGAAHV